MSEWICVNDALPEDGKIVLAVEVIVDSVIAIPILFPTFAWLDSQGGWHAIERGNKYIYVLGWKPMPDMNRSIW